MSENNKDKSTPTLDKSKATGTTSTKAEIINLDEFNLDTLDLDNLDSLLEKTIDPKAKSTPPSEQTTKQSHHTGDVSLDLDFSVTDDKPLGKSTPPTLNKSDPKPTIKPEPKLVKKADGSDILDELDALSQTQHKTKSNPNTDVKPLETAISSEEALKDELAKDAKEKALSNEKVGSTKTSITPVPKPAKKSLFGTKKTDDKTNSKAKRPARPNKDGKTNNKDTKRLLIILLGAVMALIVLIGGWFLFSSKTSEPTPPADPIPSTETSTQSVAPSVPDPAISAPTTVDGDGLDTTALDQAAANVANENTTTLPELTPDNSLPTTDSISSVDTPPPTPDIEIIDVDAITKAEIPDDIALIKEEIDRLNDKEQQLKAQAKDLDKMLLEVQELNKKKAELITLLEKEIAVLEQQAPKQ